MKPPGESNVLIKGLHLQPRDLSLLAQLGEFGLLPTDVLHARHFPDDKTGMAARRRLRLLADHGLIQTVAIAVARTGTPGRLPAFHRLTCTGADMLLHETGIQSQRPARSEIPKPHTILHRAGMARVALAFTDACRLNGLTLPTWHFEFDCVSGVSRTAPLSQRFLLRHDFAASGGTPLTCWPDALCRFVLTHQSRSWQLAIAWEYDRSTETHRQIKEKLDAYVPWLRNRAHRRAVPEAADARVFFVVPSVERLTNLVSSFRTHPCAPAVRLAVAGELVHETVLSATMWQPLDGSAARTILGAGQDGLSVCNHISVKARSLSENCNISFG